MPNNVASLQVIIGVNTKQFQKGMGELHQKVEASTKRIQNSFNRANVSLRSFGRQLNRTIGLAALSFGALAIAGAKGTEEGQASIQRLTKQFEELKKALAPIGLVLLQIAEEWFPKIIAAAKSLSQWFTGLDDGTKKLVIGLGIFLAAIGPILIAINGLLIVGKGLIGLFIGIKGAFGLLLVLFKGAQAIIMAVRSAMLLLNLAFLANPFVLVGVAIVALVGYLVYLWNTNKTFRTNVINIWNSIKAFFKAIPGFFQGVWNSVVGGLRSLGSQFSTWGKNLMNMFIGGIRSRIGAVISTVKSIGGTIRSFLGFSSPPDKGPLSNSNQWMPHFMDMLDKGLEMGIPQLQASVGDVAATIATADTIASGGTTNNNINVYPRQSNLDARGLNRELERMRFLNGGVI